MRRTFGWTPALALAVIALALVSRAEAQQLARVYMVEGKPGFVQAMSEHMETREEMEDPWEWTTLEVVNGKHLGAYVIRSGQHAWADFDRYETEFEPRVGPHFAATVLPLIEHAESWITRTDEERTRFPSDWSRISLVQVIDFHVKPGMTDRIDEAISGYHEAITEGDVPVYYAWDHLVNGSGAQRALALFHENWADMAPKGVDAVLREVHGEERAAELEEMFDEALVRTESTVLRIRPDLSVRYER